jgi:hypothetical protein
MLSVFECSRKYYITIKKSKTNIFYTKSCHMKKINNDIYKTQLHSE